MKLLKLIKNLLKPRSNPDEVVFSYEIKSNASGRILFYSPMWFHSKRLCKQVALIHADIYECDITIITVSFPKSAMPEYIKYEFGIK